MKFEKKVFFIFDILKHNSNYSDTRLLQYIFENYRFFDYIIDKYLNRKKKIPILVKAVFYVSFSEIFLFANNIDAFTINNAINFMKKSKFGFYSKLVHAILSKVVKNKNSLLRDFQNNASLAQLYSHPDWLVKKWIDNFGVENTKNLLKFNNNYSRNYIIIKDGNFDKITVLFQHKNINFSIPYEDFPEIMKLEGNYKIAELPGFTEGLFWVQDPSAYFITRLVKYIPDVHTVADLCASPGGKSVALSQDNYFIVANDLSLKKINLIKENIKRLNIDNISLLISDANNVYFTDIFDLVLLDVPCSGTGVISKKGDIKWKISSEKIESLIEIQYSILENAFNFSKYVIYSTCTLEPEENELLIKKFLENHKEVEIFKLEDIESITLSKFYNDDFFYTYPFRDNINGAFAVILKKK